MPIFTYIEKPKINTANGASAINGIICKINIKYIPIFDNFGYFVVHKNIIIETKAPKRRPKKDSKKVVKACIDKE